MKKIFISGCGGLLGSSLVKHFADGKNIMHGLENNSRKAYFGEGGDISKNLVALSSIKNYNLHYRDIRDKEYIDKLFEKEKFDAIIHTAANPSHDFPVAKEGNILLDYEVNSTATLNLLEATRLYCKDATFVHFSTNKVLGDAVNKLNLKETETRWDYADEEYFNGISEINVSPDQCVHSLFGCSKLASDVYTYEYGAYFGMKTYCLRGSCMTGSGHAGTEAHGYLNYITKCAVQEKHYSVFGYKMKQCRDNLDSRDVATLVRCIIDEPRVGGVVYNIGGTRKNSVSIIETMDLLYKLTGKKLNHTYQEEARKGDHICYITDMAKFKSHYPKWEIQYSVEDIIKDIVKSY